MKYLILRHFPAAALCAALAACGGGGANGDRPGSDDPVEQQLLDLGVDVTKTPRVDDDQDLLPEDYSPFGSARTFDAVEELYLLGMRTDQQRFNTRDAELTLLELNRNGTSATYQTSVFRFWEPAQTPWAVSVGANPANLRAATRGDYDADGLEELAVVYRLGGQSAIQVQIYEDDSQNFNDGQTFTVTSNPAERIELASGDFNGDGHMELVVGLATGNGAELHFIDNTDGVLGVSGEIRTLPQAFPGSELDLIIESGNLDYDPSHELVIVVNERYVLGNNPENGTSRFFVLDDRHSAYHEVARGPIEADLAAVNRRAIVADVAIGDIDADNVDEILFAGLTNFDPNGTCAYNYLLVVRDDLKRELVPLAATEQAPDVHDACGGGELRFVHINTLDIDGDGAIEVQANELLFDDFVNFPPWTPLVDSINEFARIPHRSLFGWREDDSGDEFTGRFSRDNSTMTVADLSNDGNQDIAFYSQATNTLQVWGLSEPDANLGVQAGQWRELHSVPVEDPGAEPIRPLLQSANVNHDSLAISFDAGTYRLVFTEPVLIAALAGAPCADNLGQNLDVCRTAFGQAESSTVATEDTFTITAGVTVGFESEFSVLGVKAVGLEVLGTVETAWGFVNSRSYTLTRRVVYTTGPTEDNVIFTTVPLDQYTYTITSHPDAEMIGARIVVSLPREPVEFQVERSFYNASVIAGGPLIDSSVFRHVLGDPQSYPDAAAKDALVARYSGLETGPEAVGQGNGDKTLEINVATETGQGQSFGVGFSLDVQATAGVVVAGFSVGVEGAHSLTIVHGEESSYAGTVANIPDDRVFADNPYKWGLVTYVMDDHASQQQFEVVNYWVE